METHYVRISLGAPGVGVLDGLHLLFDILNKRPPGLGWEAGFALDGIEFVIYRDVADEKEFDLELRRLRGKVGGDDYAYEADEHGQRK